MLLGVSLGAQTTTTGAIGGVISDPQGATISGAVVTLRNNATDAKETTKSNAGGAYRFDLVPPGTYTLTVDQPGFDKEETGVTVSNSQVVATNLRLAVGSDQQTIEVTANSELLQAENGNVATTISQAQVAEIPNSGNNLLFETKITPGFGTGFGVVGNTQYQIDGENYNDPYNNANNSGASNLTLGLNDVSEATITGNGYSGQYGGLVGASVSYSTKNGGNRFHGDASWFWTGSSLIANTYLHKAASPIVQRSFENANQWSGLISGPITIPHLFNGHDKLFFLADAEGLRAILPGTPSQVALPSPTLEAYTLQKLASNGLSASIPYYQSMFTIYNAAAVAHSAQPGNSTFSTTAAFPNATATGCPTSANSLDPTDLAGLGLVNTAAPGLPPVYIGPAGACGLSYASTASTYATEALEIFRVDANISTSDKAFVRFAHDNGIQPTTIDPVSSLFNAISIQPQNDGQFNETHNFGAKAVNNAILGFLWYGALFDQPSELAAAVAAFPAQLALSDSSLTTLGGTDGTFPEGRKVSTMQLQDDIAISLGAHTLKFGGKGYLIKENDYNYGAGTVPTETVSTLGAFINGGFDPYASSAFQSTSKNVTTYTNATSLTQSFPTKPNHAVLQNQLAVYAEDDWKPTRALSLTFALRLEHEGNVQCLDNCLTQLSTGFTSLNHTATIPYNQAYSFNQSVVFPGLQEVEWEPRFGFAYSGLHDTAVVRGGFGIFYDGLAASVLEGVAKNPPGKPSFAPSQDYLAKTQTAANGHNNLFNDAVTDNTTFGNALASGGTLASITAAEAALAPPIVYTPPNVYTPQPNFKMYYVEKFNFEVQKSVGSKDVVSINYLGNHGVHRPYTNAGLNAFNIGTKYNVAGLPNQSLPVDPRFGIVYYYVSGGSTNYNGVITTYTHKFNPGSIFTAGYTYGKTLSTGANGISTSTATGTTDIGAPPDPYHPTEFYGPDSTDIRHYFVADYVYKVPFKNIFYGGWQVSGAAFAYSGSPFTVIDTKTTGSINGYTTGAYGASLLAIYNGGGESRCNYGQNVCLASSEFQTLTAGNPTLDQTGVGVNGPRNAFRGPMYVSTDLAVTKDIPLHWEAGRFSVAAQAFNVLNHLNFNKPTGSLSSGSFGKVTTTINPTGIFSGVGGDDSPRILQLKAKVVF